MGRGGRSLNYDAPTETLGRQDSTEAQRDFLMTF